MGHTEAVNRVGAVAAVAAVAAAVAACLLLLASAPAASAQAQPGMITTLQDFGAYQRGEPLLVYGQIAAVTDGSRLILQVVNPSGDLCQIQQLAPLPNGMFVTDVIPLQGRLCGVPGEYEIRLFYGDYTRSAAFEVLPEAVTPRTDPQRIASAQALVSGHASAISAMTGVPLQASGGAAADLPALESAYVSLWARFHSEDLVFEIDPMIRPAISSSLDSVGRLLEGGTVSPAIADSISRAIYAAVFHFETGDRARAADLLAGAFADIRNATPEKAGGQAGAGAAAPSRTFEELEETLLNLMKKSDTVMSRDVKTEVGFIFARGTAPLHAAEISQLVDTLSKSRYLDAMSRNDKDLYRLVRSDWTSLRSSMAEKGSIGELVASGPRVAELHTATLLLRDLDDVVRFTSLGDGGGDVSSADRDGRDSLVALITPDWERMESRLALATSVSDILEAEPEIRKMIQVIEISSRLSKSIAVMQASGGGVGGPTLLGHWRGLLEAVGGAQSSDEILGIVSEFDRSMADLRQKRSPLAVLEFEYAAMKERAELQADHQNLFTISNALKVLDAARQVESGSPSPFRLDRIEVLLAWASAKAPQIRADLDSYDRDAFNMRAGDILQRAQSLENLVEMSSTKNRFLPNYGEFTEEFGQKIDRARELVVSRDLRLADQQVRALFEEWVLVSGAYASDPTGSEVGYTVDELKRIELRKELEALSGTVATFHNSGFAQYEPEYNRMMADAHDLIEITNFVDADSKIREIGEYLADHLVLKSPGIIYDISFDDGRDVWILQGATEKSRFDEREDLHATVYSMDGSRHSQLEFTATRQGDFYTQWVAPAEPGLYVVMLEYKGLQATRLVHVEDGMAVLPRTASDIDLVGHAREFGELEAFAERFGGEAFAQNARFASVVNEIRSKLADRETRDVGGDIEQLKTIMERYLPVRSPEAVIEAVHEEDRLVLSGAVRKELEFREDLFVDIYDQRGDLVTEVALKDDPAGLFSIVVSGPLKPGIYVAQLEYHDIAVTDIFNVR